MPGAAEVASQLRDLLEEHERAVQVPKLSWHQNDTRTDSLSF